MEGIVSIHAQQYAEDKYEKMLPLLGMRRAEITACMEGLTGDERILMEFLYGTMPICDAADYEPQLLYAYVRHALFLRRQKKWTRELPEEVFLNYVLYYRVNNENITDCRGWFYEMLWPLVENLSEEEAVKEVNYWCARQASYTSADPRTLSPAGVFKSGSGRCGEESTFLVTALRSIGIAARQVYTPIWAHCDDNHAWVEAWVDGGWRFLGACEPEEVLNKGWFTNASSRAMMIHTRVFSDYQSGKAEQREELTERDGAAYFYNDTPSYALTSPLKVRVRDEAGSPAVHARVSFELLNAAAHYPVSVLYTDQKGEVSLNMGLGSVCLVVSWKNCFCERLVENRENTTVEVVMREGEWEESLKRQEQEWQYLEHIAPRDYPMHPVKLTAQQKETGRKKKHEAEQRRREKLDGFARAEQCKRYPEAEEILALSYGNYPEICRFLEEHPGREARELLSVLSKKDYRDIHADLLGEHFDYGREVKEYSYGAYLQDEEDPWKLFLNYVWNPRIQHEMITPYRSFLTDALSAGEKEDFCREPAHIWKWIRERVTCLDEKNYHPVITSPAGVLRVLQGSEKAQKILFVAICRTLGIPARLNPVSYEAEYYRDHRFHDVSSAKQEEKMVLLKLKSQEQPEYHASWTIGRLIRDTERKEEDARCRFETLDLRGREFCDGQLTLTLPEGIYRLITTVRLPNGNQLEARRVVDTTAFTPGESGMPEQTMELVIRKPRLDQMLEKLALDHFTLRREDGSEAEAADILEGRITMLAFLEEGMEPTEHFLNELMERREEIGQSGLKLVFVVTGRQAYDNPTFAAALREVPAEVYYDDFTELPEILARRMYTDPERLPLVALISPDMTGRYASSGYNVGSVGLMLRIAKMLTEEEEN